MFEVSKTFLSFYTPVHQKVWNQPSKLERIKL